MRLLLDTHALIWWLAGKESVTPMAAKATGEPSNEVLVSAASAFEITTKHRLGKLPQASLLAANVHAQLDDHGFTALPISLAHAERAGRLPGPQRDPFDRLLIAQALLDDLTLVCNETSFDAYGVSRLW